MLLNKFRQFMYGRYGSDQLSLALIVSAMVLSFANLFLSIIYLQLLSTFLIFFSLFRMLSKNYIRRRKENEWYLRFFDRLKNIVKFKSSKKFKYFKCPNCKVKLRVPRGRGALKITCPKCRESFRGKS